MSINTDPCLCQCHIPGYGKLPIEHKCCNHSSLTFNEPHMLSIEERVKKLEEHHTRQIDENRKISRRVDELEEQIKILTEIPMLSKQDSEIVIEALKNPIEPNQKLKDLLQKKTKTYWVNVYINPVSKHISLGEPKSSESEAITRGENSYGFHKTISFEIEEP